MADLQSEAPSRFARRVSENPGESRETANKQGQIFRRQADDEFEGKARSAFATPEYQDGFGGNSNTTPAKREASTTVSTSTASNKKQRLTEPDAAYKSYLTEASEKPHQPAGDSEYDSLKPRRGRVRPFGRLPTLEPGEKTKNAAPCAIWFRSIQQLGTNFYLAIPQDMEVNRVGFGLDWCWDLKLITAFQQFIFCPLFEQNIPMLQYALKYAIACRCEFALPDPPEELEVEILDSDSEDGCTADEVEQAPTKAVVITSLLLEEITCQLQIAVADAEKESEEPLTEKQTQEVQLKILKNCLLPRPQAQPIRRTRTRPQLLGFLDPKVILAKLTSRSKSPALLSADLENIVFAWDDYAKKHNEKPCSYYYEKAKRLKWPFDISDPKDELAWLNRQDPVRLYGKRRGRRVAEFISRREQEELHRR